MNKMHTLAKIALATIGIYFAIRMLSQAPLAIFWFYSKPSWETAVVSLLSLLLDAGLIALLLYFFFYKNENLAQKIVGSEQLPEPDSQIQWLPLALRLICIAGGLYFIAAVLWRITYVVNQLAFLKAQENVHTISPYVRSYYQDLFPWIIMLICGIYLLCGAPHFVRWHVKKILQMCKSSTETK